MKRIASDKLLGILQNNRVGVEGPRQVHTRIRSKFGEELRYML